MNVGTKFLCLKDYENNNVGMKLCGTLTKDTIYTCNYIVRINKIISIEEPISQPTNNYYYSLTNLYKLHIIKICFNEDGTYYLNNGNGNHVFSEYFITLADFRENRINKILND